MRKLSNQEFISRTKAVLDSMRIFVPHITDNISIALKLYNEILAEGEVAETVTNSMVNRSIKRMDIGEIPCPECGNNMILRSNSRDINDKIWPSSLYCGKCFSEFYFDITAESWVNNHGLFKDMIKNDIKDVEHEIQE